MLDAGNLAQDKLEEGGGQGAGSISGISLASVLELLSREGKTCLFEVAIPGDNSGLIYFYQGMIWNAVFEKQQGEEALFALLSKNDVRINFLKLPKKKVKRGVFGNVMSLLLKWSIKTDETENSSVKKTHQEDAGRDSPAAMAPATLSEDLSSPSSPASISPRELPAGMTSADLPEELQPPPSPEELQSPPPAEELQSPPHDDDEEKDEDEPDILIHNIDNIEANDIENVQEAVTAREGTIEQHESGTATTRSGEVLYPQLSGDKAMGQIDDILGKFRDIEGFQAVGVFSPEGEMVAVVNNSGLKIDEVGALANDVLLKAQKATEIMGVGRGETVHIDAPKGHVISRCLNESTDFSVSTQGRAHIHVVLIISKEGNLAMAKIRLSSTMNDLAPLFR